MKESGKFSTVVLSLRVVHKVKYLPINSLFSSQAHGNDSGIINTAHLDSILFVVYHALDSPSAFDRKVVKAENGIDRLLMCFEIPISIDGRRYANTDGENAVEGNIHWRA